jgi:hypothetical protein
MLNWGQQRAREDRFAALVLPHLDALHYAAMRVALRIWSKKPFCEPIGRCIN